MKIINSNLLERTGEIIFGFSTKLGLEREAPFNFNMSFTVGDNEEIVRQNRDAFFRELGLSADKIAYQKQIHSDIIKIVEEPGFVGESDALITKTRYVGLAVSSADCTPIFIYDRINKVIAAVHSGWRGTSKEILKKTLNNLKHHFNSVPGNLLVYVGPSISQKNYQVGEEVAIMFDPVYIDRKDGKLYLDVRQTNIDMLLEAGIQENQIEISNYCTFEENKLLHSYRRDGIKSGRALGVIAMKDNNGFRKV